MAFRTDSPRFVLCVAVVILLIVAASFALSPPVHGQEVRQEFVRVTFFLPTGNVMRDGTWPYVGAAACGSYFPMGTVLELPDGFQVECRDTGYLGRAQVDIYSPSMSWGRSNIEAAYGAYATVSVVRWGYE